MTIRTRLTLWYAGIFSASLLVIGVMMYSELVVEQRAKIARHHSHKAVDDDAGTDITQIILIYGGTAVVVGLMGGWWLTRRAFAPVAALTEAVEKIQENNLGVNLARTGNGDELDRLTEVFNAMTARLNESFKRIREFTLHASHELKTPLTILHGDTETALRDETIPAAQRERLASQLDEIQRLAKIVDGLTLLTKEDAGLVQLKSLPLAFDELVCDAFEDAQILARTAKISVRLRQCDAVKIRGDRHRLRQLLLNLTDNAVKYNEPGGSVIFSLRQNGALAELEIVNTGKGIPAAVLPRLGERFFRGDPANNALVDGCGLGLSIVQWIVSAHGGKIQIASAPSQSTIVTVKLPLLT